MISAMPGFIALKLCPKMRFVKPDFTKYSSAAATVRSVLRVYDPDMRTVGLDEATLDLSPYLLQHPDMRPEVVAREIRDKITAATRGLTASCGIAPSRWLAKVSS
jgi:DNA polymerase kappa